MSDEQEEMDRLYEALTIEGRYVDSSVPGYYQRGRTWGGWGRSRWWKDCPQDIEYRNVEGKLHRIYGPAYISPYYKIEEWYKEGKRHRIGGPARTHKDSKWWYVDGKLHRLDGPAVEMVGHPKEYWIGGQRLSPKEYKKEIDRRKRKGLIK